MAVTIIGRARGATWLSRAVSDVARLFVLLVMPRILPRLVKKIAASPPRPFESFKLPNTRKVSLRKPVPSTPSFHPAEYQQSILLSPNNPVSSSSQYVQHKSLPPRIRVGKRVKSREQGDDPPREMTEEERRWWSSPYRM